MFIVIEGTDASGKSTLVSEVQKQLTTLFPNKEIEFFHKSKPEEMTRRWVLNDYVTSIESIDWHERIAVADRWHWGEVTYAPLKRPESDSDGYGLLGKAGWRWTELFLASRGVAQFWLYQPLAVIKERLSKRGDDYISEDELEKILELYKFASSQSAGLAGTLSPKSDSLDEVPDLAQTVTSNAQYQRDLVAPLRQFPWYIGPRYPSVLLVGDQRNILKKYGEETILPFMPVDSNSGEFLLNALPDSIWRTCGIINVNDHHVQEVDELWHVLGRPQIIALGRLAERGLRNHGCQDSQYVVLPHPQYVRRFFNSQKELYGDAIARQVNKYEREHTWILR